MDGHSYSCCCSRDCRFHVCVECLLCKILRCIGGMSICTNTTWRKEGSNMRR
jgi:hypothetical protein